MLANKEKEAAINLNKVAVNNTPLPPMSEAVAEWLTSPGVSVLLDSLNAGVGFRMLIISAMNENRVDVIDWFIRSRPAITFTFL